MSGLTGCTTYEIRKISPDGSSVEVLVKSSRNFEQPSVHFSREGEDVEFDFGASSATTRTSPIENAFGDAIRTGALSVVPVAVPNKE